MSEARVALSPQLKAFKTTDISPLIRMSGLMMPRLMGAFLPKLDVKQRKAFDRVLPAGGQKKIFIHLVGTPTPPILIEIAQPLKMSVVPEYEIKKQGAKGVRLTLEDLQAILERRILKILWRLKGQMGALLSIAGMFLPFLFLGPAELKDLKKKALAHFKPLLELLPRPKK